MRQAGVVASMGLFAIQNNTERLAEDHVRAKRVGITGNVGRLMEDFSFVVLIFLKLSSSFFSLSILDIHKYFFIVKLDWICIETKRMLLTT